MNHQKEMSPMNPETTLSSITSSVFRDDAQYRLNAFLQDLVNRDFDIISSGDRIESAFWREVRHLEMVHREHMPFRLRMATKVKSGEIFRPRWIRNAFTTASGVRLAKKTFGVDKATHATTDMDEIRSQCPAVFLPVLNDTEEKITALRTEMARLDPVLGTVFELQELFTRMKEGFSTL